MNNEYKYAGKPFTVKIAEELILELCDGETLKRAVIIERVHTKHHLKQGGLEYAGRQSLGITFNDALQNLRKRGLSDNNTTNSDIPPGHWKIKAESPPDDPLDESTESCVYIYYYPAYKELAEFKGEDKFPCKIGCTGRGADKRIKKQETGMPEQAKKETIMHTDDPHGLEQMISYLLKRNDMHIA